jgi:hypothetical protein
VTVTNHTWEDFDDRVPENVRKALRGSLFLAPTSADLITSITIDGADAGTPTLNVLPDGYTGAGQLSDAGLVLGNQPTVVTVPGWGRTSPVRADITTNQRTIQGVGLETNKMTLALYFQVDPSTITPDATTAEVQITEPDSPTVFYWRALALAVDQTDDGEIYLARFFPRASVTNLGNMTFDSAADTINFDCTLTAYTDTDAGYSSKFFAGGPGWKPLKTGMGFS